MRVHPYINRDKEANKLEKYLDTTSYRFQRGMPPKNPPRDLEFNTGGDCIAVVPVITDGNDTLRFGSSALNANEYNGRVNVNRWNARNLSNSYGNEGGRVAEAIQDTKMPR